MPGMMPAADGRPPPSTEHQALSAGPPETGAWSGLRTIQETISRLSPDPLGAFVVKSLSTEKALTRIVDELPASSIASTGDLWLSRGGGYYTERASTGRIERFAQWCQRHAGALRDHDDLRLTLLDLLYNEIAELAFYLECRAIEAKTQIAHRQSSDAARLARLCMTTVLDIDHLPRFIGSALDFVSAQGETTVAWQPRFRELDNLSTVADETAYLTEFLLPQSPEIQSIVIPLSGARKLGDLLAAASGTDRQVVNIRLGFHDLRPIGFHTTSGRLAHYRIVDPFQLDKLTAAVSTGLTLIVDDNVGTGQTLRAARTFVHEAGGQAVTRAAETAWALYERTPGHSLTRTVDLPSLRPNLHHTWIRHLSSLLATGRFSEYLRATATTRPRLTEQLDACLHLAVATNDWSSEQLRHLRHELGFARTKWRTPGIPWSWTQRYPATCN